MENALSPQFIKPPAIKLSPRASDLWSVNPNHQLPEEPIRSKGQATLLPAGRPELSATIRDISASGIGALAASLIDPGTLVDIHVHDHVAHGVVRSCQPEGDAFYIGIELAD